MVISDKNGEPLQVKDLPYGNYYMFSEEAEAVNIAKEKLVYKIGSNYYVEAE